jgi:hypothetical protein
MTQHKATALVSAAFALLFAFETPGRAQAPTPDSAQQEPEGQQASNRKKAPVEIEQAVEGYLIARMDVVEDTRASDKGTEAVNPIANYVHYGATTIAGGSTGDAILTITGWNFGTSAPYSVQVQTRQASNNPNTGYPDQFAVQVLSTTSTSLTVRIRRMDDGVGSSGWGQNLRLDFMVIP